MAVFVHDLVFVYFASDGGSRSSFAPVRDAKLRAKVSIYRYVDRGSEVTRWEPWGLL